MKPKRVLVFCDDLYHPAVSIRAGLSPLERTGDFSFDWVVDPRDWSPAALEGHDRVLLAKSNVLGETDRTPWLVGERREIFRSFVRRGGGLLAVHSGTASYKDVEPVRAILGGVFERNPAPCVVTLVPESGHALTRGVPGPFTVHDEHFQMVLDDPQADIFLRSRSAHGEQPAGWTRREGEGRVCVLTPGHYATVWLEPRYQRLLRNALDWIAA